MAKTLTLAQMRAQLKKLTPGTSEYKVMQYAIRKARGEPSTQGATPGVTNVVTPAPTPTSTTTSKAPTGTISFDYDKMVAQKAFTPTKRNVKAMNKTTIPAPSFINGGTSAQKAALAKKIANMTITSGMSAADAAKIRTARLWYTGQTEGRHGKTAAVFDKGSVKDQLVRGKKAFPKQTAGGKPPKGPGTAHVTLRNQNRGGTSADIANWMSSGQNPVKPSKPKKR